MHDGDHALGSRSCPLFPDVECSDTAADASGPEPDGSLMRMIKAPQPEWGWSWRAVWFSSMLLAALSGCHVAPGYDPYSSRAGPMLHGSRQLGLEPTP
jgi:hypothetical protein